MVRELEPEPVQKWEARLVTKAFAERANAANVAGPISHVVVRDTAQETPADTTIIKLFPKGEKPWMVAVVDKDTQEVTFVEEDAYKRLAIPDMDNDRLWTEEFVDMARCAQDALHQATIKAGRS